MKRATGMLILTAAVVVTVVAYNSWLYCWGRCTLENLTRLSLPGGLLLAGNGLALGVLIFLKLTPVRRPLLPHCRCGALIEDEWRFCGHCGADLEKP
ncbi:zinc-ribbon domain-containing protein [Geoalkalibacter halelectricus]|uniref:Zinc-ribbon domain-containing protein n=1 Tax=Geoalkalibacter halelectricus TaxID=2847045 RepID=A0ABY5ZI50_9BACT|nr:zinc-ribbon domain-containing protein [Geoalkalibacter halelectricus]MDO3379369.1 zinc-ribbon domain-containing protein [Geoalkalibacter halelectricus]UWZ78753.1 zinc-ribbon domain-containing protein [Geoalkalibacter halelectricus]